MGAAMSASSSSAATARSSLLKSNVMTEIQGWGTDVIRGAKPSDVIVDCEKQGDANVSLF